MSAPRAPLPAGPALIPAGCAYSGRVLFRGLARVEGRLEGEVSAEGRLEIGPRAEVEARIEVDELVVAGALAGEVIARERVQLLESARVCATLRTPRLGLEEGCRFEGRCETESRPESARS